MAIKTRAELAAKIDAVIKENTAGEITDAVLNDLLKDIKDSMFNVAEDNIELKEYDPERNYVAGNTILKDGQLKEAVTDTTGEYNREAWRDVNKILINTTVKDLQDNASLGRLTVGRYLITDSGKADAGLVVEAGSKSVVGSIAIGVFLLADYNLQGTKKDDVKGVWKETMMTVPIDDLDGEFEIGEKVINTTKDEFGYVVAIGDDEIILNNLSSANIVWADNDELVGDTSEAEANVNGAATNEFPIVEDSIVIRNGLHYKNTTGLNTDVSADMDAENWLLMPKSVDNGYILEYDKIDYDLKNNNVGFRYDKRGNVVPAESNFQWGNDLVNKNVFTLGSEINNINQRGTYRSNVALQIITLIQDETCEGSVLGNIFVAAMEYTLNIASGKSIFNCYLKTNGGSFTADYYSNLLSQKIGFTPQYVTPEDEESVAISTYHKHLIINAEATLSELTLIIPATNLWDGKQIEISSLQQITSLIIESGDIDLIGNPESMGVGSMSGLVSIVFTYLKEQNMWLRTR